MTSSHLPGAAYAGATGAILQAASDMGAYCAHWAMRHEDRPDAAARQAANEAMDAIDTALRELHRLRERLITDIRRSDDALETRLQARYGDPR